MAHRTVIYGAVLLTAGLYSVTGGQGWAHEDENWQPLLAAPPTVSAWPGRGLTYLSHWLTSQTPRGAHLGNVALHLLNGGLLAILLGHLTTPPVAAGAALVFWLHPFQTGAVAYATGRSDLLMTTFILAGLLVGTGAGWWRAIVSGVLLGLAGMAKEIGVIAVPLAAWTWWQWKRPEARWAGWATLVVIGAVLGLAWAALVTWFEMPARVGGSALGWPLFLLLQLAAVWHLITLMVWPVGLSIEHDVAGVVARILAVSATVGAVWVSVWAWRRLPMLTWAMGWVAICVAPRFVFRTSEFVTEPQMYLATVGPCVLFGARLTWLWKGSDVPDLLVSSRSRA